MTEMLRETVQRARGVARDLVNDSGFVSQLHRGFIGTQERALSVRYAGRKRFSEDCRMLLDGGGQPLLSTGGEAMGLIRFVMDRLKLQDGADQADVSMLDTFMTQGDLTRATLFAPHVDAVLPIQSNMVAQLDQFRSNGARKKLQGLLKRGFAWRLSTAEDDFKKFYWDMYLPTAHARFGAEVSVVPFAELEEGFRKCGTLIFACNDDGVPEAAGLLTSMSHRPHVLHYWKAGVAHCDALSPAELTEQYSRVEAAILQYAIHERFGEIHLGVTRALPTDGVFVHKKRMGCLFHHNPAYADMELRVKPEISALLFSHRPVMMWRGSQLECWAGQDGELDTTSATQLRDRLSACAFPPVKRVQLFVRGVVNSRAMLNTVTEQIQREYSCPIELTETV